MSTAIPEKFLENGFKPLLHDSVGCLYPYLESKKLHDGSNAFYPRVVCERDPNNPFHWRWGFNWKEKHNGVWKGRSIGSIPPGAVPMIRLRAIAKTHHHNFSEYGCRIIQLTVQEVAQSGFIGFPRRPDYLHASPVCANFSQAHTAKAGKGIETADDLSAANRQVGASLSQ
jgi:DNA (cytosine-5)-methyltransferase 1